MAEQYSALLITKLYIPRLRSASVSRPHLLAVLDHALERRLTLIAAAAGFGKTTLLADWCSQSGNQVGWLSLDEGDNDPSRFLSYLIASIQMCHPAFGQELLAALQSSQPPVIDNTLQSLINQMATIPDRTILILDDYHVIDNQTIHSALSFLVEHLPPQFHLVILTRTDPPLLLARLRAQNDLLELRAADLRFSVDEAHDFLNQTMQLDLPRQVIADLDIRTEGWIAGLQLAALAMQPLRDDRQAFVRDFTGSHRFILDYLMEEVLSRQPEDVRRFLLHTSILNRLNGALCSAVTDSSNGQALLEYLERNNLFLIPLDQSRGWYRYHHLFADLLQARLQAEDPAALQPLRQRAARWHDENGFAEEAVVYALAAEDYDHAAELITGSAVDVAQRGEVVTLLDWYRTFPPDFVANHPKLGEYFGVAFALHGQWTEAEALLNAVEQHPAGASSERLLLSYLVAVYRHDAARLAAIEAESRQPRDKITKLVRGLVLSLSGDLRAACHWMIEAQADSEREGDLSLALTALFHQCRFKVYLGELHEAYALCQTALERVGNKVGLPLATFAHSSLGRILIEWNEPEQAAEHLAEAIRLAELSGFFTGMISSSMIMQAEVKQAQGDIDGAIQIVQAGMASAERYDPPNEVWWLTTYQARLWLIQDNKAAYANWLRESEKHESSPSLFYPYAIQRVTQARILLAQRKHDRAIALLTQLAAEPQHLLTVEILALLALARQGIHAEIVLDQALTLGEAENRVRAFLDLGAPMAKLLAQYCGSHPDASFAHKLLAAFPAAYESSPERLSERELEVLRLIVAGYSNDEIAQTLTLASSTVKWYINTLYSKLHVKTRSQAIARTHELRLLID